MKKNIIEETERFVRKELGDDVTGHDWFHVDRVRRNALHICKQEGKGDPFIIEMAALLHDIPDEKLNESMEKGEQKLHSFLESLPIGTIAKAHIKK
ncbi:HD domain-containing protein [Neobacillus thermocopriae]